MSVGNPAQVRGTERRYSATFGCGQLQVQRVSEGVKFNIEYAPRTTGMVIDPPDVEDLVRFLRELVEGE